MKNLFKLLMVGCMISISTSSLYSQWEQSPNDKDLIEATVQNYFDGWLTGDTTLIGSAMHETCKLKNVKDDKVKVFGRSEYLSFFSPRPRLENAGGKILAIDVTAIVATVKCQLMTSNRVFVDYFNMMKVKDRWYIVDKVSTNRARTEADKL